MLEKVTATFLNRLSSIRQTVFKFGVLLRNSELLLLLQGGIPQGSHWEQILCKYETT